MIFQLLGWDRISDLPEETIEKILSLMPIRDALRTSILSRKWRYLWTRMPALVFDDQLVTESSKHLTKSKTIINSAFHVLLLHKGSVLEFSITIGAIKFVNEIDPIILHILSNNIDKLIKFKICLAERKEIYKMPSLFYSLQGLEHLDLTYCAFEVPLMFNGFTSLKSLRFCNVDITMKTLQQLLTNCPLLEKFTLIGNKKGFIEGENKCRFMKLLECLPSVQVLEISENYVKHFAAGGMPHKLPTSLDHLRKLALDVSFVKQNELSSLLCVINSSPNLEKIKVEMCGDHKLNAQQTFYNFFDLHEYSDLNLNHLKELEITRFGNFVPEKEFVKLVLGKSPKLKKARIELDLTRSVTKEVTMHQGLLHMPFPRASPAANVVVEVPKIKRRNT